jgi:hypothetical protein
VRNVRIVYVAYLLTVLIGIAYFSALGLIGR